MRKTDHREACGYAWKKYSKDSKESSQFQLIFFANEMTISLQERTIAKEDRNLESIRHYSSR